MNTQTTRDKIIEAADKLFRQHGYEATGVRDIAAASGVSISNLQYYFPKKVSIMAAVYQKTIESYFQDIELEDGDNYESLIQIMALEYEFILRAYNGNEKDSYLSSLSFPEVCSAYADNSTRLISDTNLFAEVPKAVLHLTNIAMFGGLYQTLHFYMEHSSEYSLYEAVSVPMKGRLLSLGISADSADVILTKALQMGEKLSNESRN